MGLRLAVCTSAAGLTASMLLSKWAAADSAEDGEAARAACTLLSPGQRRRQRQRQCPATLWEFGNDTS